MKNLLLILTSLFFFATTGCKNQSSLDENLPNTPEEVIQQYQAWIDNNQFAEAKHLSTPRERARLEELAEIIADDLIDSTILHSVFLEIRCQTIGDTSRCRCKIEDEYETYTIEYRLLRVKGQWLVDAPEDSDIPTEEIIDDILKQAPQELQ